MLVLCPNHHAVFDLGGALFLSPNYVMISGQRFNIKTKHALSDAVTDYNNSIAVR